MLLNPGTVHAEAPAPRQMNSRLEFELEAQEEKGSKGSKIVSPSAPEPDSGGMGRTMIPGNVFSFD